MEASEQTRFDALYSQHLRALKLQGKAEATVGSYARAVRRNILTAAPISYRLKTSRTISRP